MRWYDILLQQSLYCRYFSINTKCWKTYIHKSPLQIQRLSCSLVRMTERTTTCPNQLMPCFGFSSHLLLSLPLFPLTRSPGFPSGPGLTPVPADGQLGATDGQWRCAVGGACLPLNNLSKDLVWGNSQRWRRWCRVSRIHTSARGLPNPPQMPDLMAGSVTGSRFPNPENHTQAENPAPKVPFFDPKIFHITSDTHFHPLLLYSPFSFKALNFYLL